MMMMKTLLLLSSMALVYVPPLNATNIGRSSEAVRGARTVSPSLAPSSALENPSASDKEKYVLDLLYESPFALASQAKQGYLSSSAAKSQDHFGFSVPTGASDPTGKLAGLQITSGTTINVFNLVEAKKIYGWVFSRDPVTKVWRSEKLEGHGRSHKVSAETSIFAIASQVHNPTAAEDCRMAILVAIENAACLTDLRTLVFTRFLSDKCQNSPLLIAHRSRLEDFRVIPSMLVGKADAGLLQKHAARRETSSRGRAPPTLSLEEYIKSAFPKKVQGSSEGTVSLPLGGPAKGLSKVSPSLQNTSPLSKTPLLVTPSSPVNINEPLSHTKGKSPKLVTTKKTLPRSSPSGPESEKLLPEAVISHSFSDYMKTLTVDKDGSMTESDDERLTMIEIEDEEEEERKEEKNGRNARLDVIHQGSANGKYDLTFKHDPREGYKIMRTERVTSKADGIKKKTSPPKPEVVSIVSVTANKVSLLNTQKHVAFVTRTEEPDVIKMFQDRNKAIDFLPAAPEIAGPIFVLVASTNKSLTTCFSLLSKLAHVLRYDTLLLQAVKFSFNGECHNVDIISMQPPSPNMTPIQIVEADKKLLTDKVISTILELSINGQ